MELTFDGGKFVSSKGELNYKEVLEHFPQVGTIRILTYNISRNQCFDKLMDALKNSCADIHIITNVPSRMEKYYDSDAGHRMKEISL